MHETPHDAYKEAVTKFLRSHPRTPYCDECIRKQLNLSRTVLREQDMATNASESKLVRQTRMCAVCRGVRITAYAP
jgi:hypothetical protein